MTLAPAQARRTASATSRAGAPPAASCAPASTAYPIAMPSARESITVTGTSDCSAARWALLIVLDMASDRCTETTESAPAATAAS